ncbi:C1 family peptidase [Desulfobacterium sp. N47]|uniref:Peptidase C1A papain C-terminal domain-containing protein n=1 Tax=uncultured Desulfobacterium sp. TaxID=201089 RepID=E1Y811_9BACT|nr:hypothetical protein N47_A07340 [uncultured Desulfobacterium sp.]
MFTLKDGSKTNDIRLDRVKFFDDRSKEYPVRRMVAAKKLRSYTWRCNVYLDQGREGACVGFGISHELAARPAEVPGLTNAFAREAVYWEAQKIDEWPGGSYPGAQQKYEGTSVLSGVKIVQKKGFFDSYYWGFSLNDLALGVGYRGPAVLGLPWLENMFDTDDKGFIHATGDEMGGHCILCRGVNAREKYFLLRNSWGRDWGVNGDCKISFDDMKKLLANGGESVFFQNRHNVAL